MLISPVSRHPPPPPPKSMPPHAVQLKRESHSLNKTKQIYNKTHIPLLSFLGRNKKKKKLVTTDPIFFFLFLFLLKKKQRQQPRRKKRQQTNENILKTSADRPTTKRKKKHATTQNLREKYKDREAQHTVNKKKDDRAHKIRSRFAPLSLMSLFVLSIRFVPAPIFLGAKNAILSPIFFWLFFIKVVPFFEGGGRGFIVFFIPRV